MVIGSDQVAELDGLMLDKPGDCRARTRANAAPLAGTRGALPYRGMRARYARARPSRTRHVDLTRVRFRELTSREITRYIEREQPLDCAGSFKCEGLGIGLFERIDSSDPTALIGLPLIALARFCAMRACGLP